MKTCNKCRRELPSSEFFNSRANKDGKHPWCKVCFQRKVSEYKKAHPELRRLQDRRWRQNNRERDRANKDASRLRNMDTVVEGRRRWRVANPEKRQAHDRVKKAIQKGILVRPEKCQACGVFKKVVAHHNDYSKPLEVDWLCQACHLDHHWQERQRREREM